DLLRGVWVEQAAPVFAQKKEKAKKRKVEVFERLLAAGQRLLSVIRRNEGGANKDLAKFADQINMLCDKWDR
ncbi:MAG: MBL fold metallo-hydrolase, partial [Lachnospiraceae bacterium]